MKNRTIQVKLRKSFRRIEVVAKPNTATTSTSPIQKTHQLYQQTQQSQNF